MDIQFQVRQNAMEMQEYMKELFDWQKSIKKKERTLVASMGAADSQSSTTPAPRGRASGAVAPPPADLMQPALGPKGPAEASKPPPAPPKAKQPDPSADDKKNAAAHTYTSYRKWDKFDIDAALASDDDEPGPSSKIQDLNAGGASKASGIGPRSIDPVAPTRGASPYSAPVAPAPSTHSFTPASSKEGISITARDPKTTGPTEDLLKPVATTRISKPAANGSSTTAQQDKAPGAPAAAPPMLPPIRNTQPTTADAWRARGNDLFKAGEYESAYECYSRSIGMEPTCLGHANRAMALLKLRRWQEAVEDCTRAIGLDPTYVKAYQRRAAAHRQLGASLEAARDWEQALRLEPENRATAADRDASVEQLLSERKLQPPSRRTAVPVSWVLPPPPPPPPPPSQQEPPQQQQQQGQEQHAPAVRGIGPASPMQRPPPSKTALPASITGGSVGMGTEAVEGRAVAAVSDSSSSVQLPAAVAPSCQPLLPPSQQQEAVATAGASPVTPGGAATGTRGVASATAATAAATAAVGGSGGASGAMKNVPRTSVEFEAAWRSMAGDLRRQAAYLAAIPPASLPSIFKNSLTAPVLASLVRCLLAGMMPLEAVPATDVSPTSISMSMTSESQSASGAVSPAQGVALLEGLTRVARFDLMVMSVPSKERQELRAGWEGVLLGLRSREGNGEGGVGASSPAPDADGPPVIESLEALRRKYRI